MTNVSDEKYGNDWAGMKSITADTTDAEIAQLVQKDALLHKLDVPTGIEKYTHTRDWLVLSKAYGTELNDKILSTEFDSSITKARMIDPTNKKLRLPRNIALGLLRSNKIATSLSETQKQMLDDLAKMFGRDLTTFYFLPFPGILLLLYAHVKKVPFDGQRFKLLSFKYAWYILQICWAMKSKNGYGAPEFNKDDYANIREFEKRTGVRIEDLSYADLRQTSADDWGLPSNTKMSKWIMDSIILRMHESTVHRNAQGAACHPDDEHPEIQRSWEERMQIEGAADDIANEITAEDGANDTETDGATTSTPAVVIQPAKPIAVPKADIKPNTAPAPVLKSSDSLRWRPVDKPAAAPEESPNRPYRVTPGRHDNPANMRDHPAAVRDDYPTPGRDGRDVTPGNPDDEKRHGRCQFRCNCRFGLTCLKEHTVDEERIFTLREMLGQRSIKSSICKHFLTKKGCSRSADECRFAHGESDSVCETCGGYGHTRGTCTLGDERIKLALERKNKAARMLQQDAQEA